MNPNLLVIIFILFVSFDANAQKERAVKIYERANDAVVRILTYQKDGSMRGQGSGVIIKDKGWVITNYHVIGDANSLFAEHKGKTFKLDSVIVIDRQRDIMVLRLSSAEDKSTLKTIPEIKLGNSDKLKVGQRVYAIGSPMGFENTLTEGIISGKRFSDDSTRWIMQISAPLSSGSSGGAILNAKGELIGISTMVISGETVQNLNFALTVNDVINAVEHAVNSTENKEKKLLTDYYNAGNNEFNSKNYWSAIMNFEKGLATTNEPHEVSEFNYFIGKCYASLKMNSKAISYYNKALETDKNNEIYEEVAAAFFDSGDDDLALDNYRKAIAINPNSDNGYLGIGMVFFRKKEYSNALVALKRSIEINPMNTNTLYLMGHIAKRLNDSKGALFFLKQAVKWKPNYADAYLAIAEIYMDLNEMSLAAQYQQMAYSLKPELRETK